MPKYPRRIHLLDGGLGTTLTDEFDQIFDDSTPLWSSHLLISDPDVLRKAQAAFAEAGADVILTATYQASREGLRRSRVEDPAAQGEVLRSAVGIARNAFGPRGGKVALGLGAYGATMVPSQEYSGRYDDDHVTEEQLERWHAGRIGVFLPGADGGNAWRDVDLVAFETLPVIHEVAAVRKVMGNLRLGGSERKKFWISCVFPGEGNILPDGSTIEEVVRAMVGRRDGGEVPLGIGLNCTKVKKVESLIEEFEAAVQKLVESGEVEEWPCLVLYPDGTAGEVYNTTTKEWEKGDAPEDLRSWDEIVYEILNKTVERGFWKEIFVGGCCKTSPSDIASLRRRLDNS
ncbi:Homocysteine S-methyltransferase [Bisporella sp. PMI_857]|nr:Homocysteine S-methyltransferase [Bisporella sp. PMI_857]